MVLAKKGKGNCWSRRGMKKGRVVTGKHAIPSVTTIITVLFWQQLFLKSYLQTFTGINCNKQFVACANGLQCNYFTLFFNYFAVVEVD